MEPQSIPTKEVSKNVETGKRKFSKNEFALTDQDTHLDDEMDETPEEISREGNKGTPKPPFVKPPTLGE